MLRHESTAYVPQEGADVGGSTMQRFRYVALRPGSAELRFGYGRSWQGEGAVEKRFRVTVLVVGEGLERR